MILHIGCTEKFMPSYIEFISENFEDEHMFYLIDYGIYPIGEYKNLVLIRKGGTLSDFFKNFFTFIDLLKYLFKSKKVIIHGLFNGKIVALLYFFRFFLDKCYWVIWGGDLYSFINMNNKFKRMIRMKVIKKMHGLITHIEGDVQLARSIFGAQGQWFECFGYISNLFSGKFTNKSSLNKKRILIGNSADPTNNHLFVFDKLRELDLTNCEVIVPLSYGDQTYASRIIDMGRNIFDNFIPLTEFMTFDKYRDLLSSVSVAFFAHNRQQGMGNAVTLLGMGKKIYLNKSTTTWDFLSSKGIKCYDIQSQLSLDSLSLEESNNNEKIISGYFSKSNLINQWKNIFNK